MAVFFDYDDTLINTAYASKVAYESVAEFFKADDQYAPLDADAIIKAYKDLLWSTPNDSYKVETPKKIRVKLWEIAIQTCVHSKFSSPYHIRGLAENLYDSWHTSRLGAMEWIEKETIPALLALRKKYKLVLITNGSSVIQWEKIKKMDASNYFDHVVVSGDEPYDKPHKSIFLKACTLCGVQPEKCVMVGDNLATDILGAHNAALLASIQYTGSSSKKKSSPAKLSNDTPLPSFTISSITELFSVLDEIY